MRPVICRFTMDALAAISQVFFSSGMNFEDEDENEDEQEFKGIQ